MNKEDLFQKLIPKDRNLEKLVVEVKQSPVLISHLLEGLQEKNARIKFGSFNTLVLISEKYPQLLYPHFTLFTEMLDSVNKILKLGSIKIISNLTKVDSENKFERVFEKFYLPITDPAMTPAANIVKGSVVIAQAKPSLINRIVVEILKIEKTTYKTEECKNILSGHVINTLDKLFNETEHKELILSFAKRNSQNPWKATSSKAVKFLKKHAKFTA